MVLQFIWLLTTTQFCRNWACQVVDWMRRVLRLYQKCFTYLSLHSRHWMPLQILALDLPVDKLYTMALSVTPLNAVFPVFGGSHFSWEAPVLVINLVLKNQAGSFDFLKASSENRSGLQEFEKQTPCPVLTLLVPTNLLTSSFRRRFPELSYKVYIYI
jgi:hypothetical protein